MAKTLQQARDTVASLLDELDADENDPRWSSTQVDRALQYAVDTCMRKYVQAGGDRFDVREELTATNGRVTFTIMPVTIRGVSLVISGMPHKLSPVSPEMRVRDSTGNHSLEVRWVREYTIPTITTHPLIGDGATGANSWPGFDEWVCATAARYLAINDGAPIPALDQLWSEIKETLQDGPQIPRMKAFQGRGGMYQGWYSYMWDNGGKFLQICSRF